MKLTTTINKILDYNPCQEGIDLIPENYDYDKEINFIDILKIAGIKKPEHHNLIKLAKDYHNLVCDDEKCIIYEKKRPLSSINPELVGGIIRYNDFSDVDKNYYFQTGLIAHISMVIPKVFSFYSNDHPMI